MSRNTFEIDTTLDITDKIQMQRLLRDALTCYAEFGHVNDDDATEEKLEQARVLGSRYRGGITVSDSYYKWSAGKLSDLCYKFEQSIKEEMNSDPDKLDILARVTNPFLSEYNRWMGVPLWSMSSKVVDKGDGMYVIEHNKDIDSSG